MQIDGEIIGQTKNKHLVGFYDGKVGDKCCVVVPYRGSFYVVFWFQFSEDGSIYCGIRDKNAVNMSRGQLNTSMGNTQFA